VCLALPFLAARVQAPEAEFALVWAGTDLLVGGESELSLRQLMSRPDGSLVMTDMPADLMPMFRADLPARVPVIVGFVALVAGAFAWLLVGWRTRAWTAVAAGCVAAGAITLGTWQAARRVAGYGPTDFPDPNYGYSLTNATVSWEYGYWLAMGLLAALVVGHLIAIRRRAH
jgi:hypothetical protein